MNGILTALVNGMIAGAAITVVVWLALRLDSGRFLNAATRYLIWCALLLMVAAAPLLYMQAGAWSESGAASQAVVVEPPVMPIRIEAPVESNAAKQTFSPDSQFPIQVAARDWQRWIGVVWAVTASFMLLRLAVCCIALERLKARAWAPTADRLTQIASGLARYGLNRRNVRFRISAETPTPVACGPFRPAILIPARIFESFDEHELNQVWLHEAAHLMRRDDVTLIAQRLIEALYVMNPLVHWISRRIELEREIACDDLVISATGETRRYAMCLTQVAELAGSGSVLPLSASATKLRSHLERRIDMLLDDTRNRGTRPQKMKLSAAVGLLLVLIGIAAGAPRIFLFAEPFVPAVPPAVVPAPQPIPNAAPSPEPVIPVAVPREVHRPAQVEAPAVQVPVVVTDPQGRYVTGLEANHFQLFEDMIEQKIVSVSAERRMVQTIIIFYSQGQSFDSGDWRAIQQRLLAAGTDTASLFMGMSGTQPSSLLGMLSRAIEVSKGPNSDKAIVIISDGMYSLDAAKENEITDLILRAGLPVNVISLAGNEPFLEELTAQSGGAFFRMDPGIHPAGLLSTLDKIMVLVRSQYVIAYRSSNTSRDGAFRKVQLKLTTPAGLPLLTLRHQTGYYAR